MNVEELHIAVGVVLNSRGEVLLARRSYDVHQGGLWEFPGGKVEPGETILDALRRELWEELQLQVEAARPLIRIHHRYPDRAVLLDVWRVTAWHGEASGREGQPIAWAAVDVLREFDFPAGNRTIITAVQLPSLYLITPDVRAGDIAFMQRLEACLRAGTRLVQLRCKRLRSEQYRPLVREVHALCKDHGAKLLLNAIPGEAVLNGVDGVHLPSARLLQLNERPLGVGYWVAASCHNHMELEHACRLGLDFAVLSPVAQTASHPDIKPLGWDAFRELTEISSIPVYALGGMLPAHMSTSWQAGGQGLAMVSGVWNSPDPAGVVRACQQ